MIIVRVILLSARSSQSRFGFDPSTEAIFFFLLENHQMTLVLAYHRYMTVLALPFTSVKNEILIYVHVQRSV